MIDSLLMVVRYCRSFRRAVVGLAAGILLLLPGCSISAAELYLEPASGVFETDKEFEIRVLVDPAEAEINAAEGVLDLSDSELDIKDIDLSSSDFRLWTEEPEWVADEDKVVFGGGSSDKITGVAELFRLRVVGGAAGLERIRFAGGSIMAPHENGSDNVLSIMTAGAYTLVSSPEEKEPEQEYWAPAGAPERPVITSTTHPDEDNWSNKASGVLEWEVESGVKEWRGELSQESYLIPTQELDQVGEYAFEDLLDGRWYFHLQAKNEAGWSEVESFRLQIDSTAPESLTVKEESREEPTDPLVKLRLAAEDPLSGIDHYTLTVEGVLEEKVAGSIDPVNFGPLPPGVHNVYVRAYDGAYNRRTESVTVEVEPIETPTFVDHPSVLPSGGILAIRGEALPEATVTVAWEAEDGDQTRSQVEADQDGRFVFVASERPDDGIYSITAKATDERGAESFYSEPIVVAVQAPGIIRVGSWAVDALTTVVTLLALIFILVFGLYYGRVKFLNFKRRLDKEIMEAEEAVEGAFRSLHQEVEYIMEVLTQAEKKRKLTAEEKNIKENLDSKLSELERQVEKEVKDIEDELNR